MRHQRARCQPGPPPSTLRRVNEDYLGAGGRLDGRTRGGARGVRLRARDRATARAWPRGSRWPIWRTPWRSWRGAAWWATRPAALLGGLLDLHEIAAGRLPLAPGAGRRVQLARARAAGARGRVGRGLAQRRGGRAARRSGWRCAWPPARGPSTCTTPSSTWRRALVDLAERHADDLAADYTYLQPAQPTTIGHLLLAYAYPPCATPDACGPSTAGSTWASPASAAARGRAGRSTARASPSCSAAPAW